MGPCPQSGAGHCFNDHPAHLICCHCKMPRREKTEVIEILVNIHASRKVPGPVQYSSDERGGSVSIRASIAPGENISGTIRWLWGEAEAELERQGLTVVRREAEVAAKHPDERGEGRPASPSKPSGGPSSPATPAPTFQPATEPSQVTADQAHAAAYRRRHAKLLEQIQKALDEKTLPKKDYASLIGLCKKAFGEKAGIGRFVDLPAPVLIEWDDGGN